MIVTLAAVGAGVTGGVYASFSLLVMPALRRLDGVSATAAMTAVNRIAERGPFLAVFGGSAVCAAVVALGAGGAEPAVRWGLAAPSLAAAALTVAVNVPLNRRLEREGAPFWARYHRRWTRANTVRALLSVAALVGGTASAV